VNRTEPEVSRGRTNGTRLERTTRRVDSNSPLNQSSLVPLPQEHLPHSTPSSSITQVPHQAEPEIPFERSGEDLLTTSEEGDGEGKVEDVFVEEGDEVVLLTEDAVGDATRYREEEEGGVRLRSERMGRKWGEGERGRDANELVSVQLERLMR